MELTIHLELSDEVSSTSRYNLIAQVSDIFDRALEENALSLPDGEIWNFSVHYEDELDFS